MWCELGTVSYCLVGGEKRVFVWTWALDVSPNRQQEEVLSGNFRKAEMAFIEAVREESMAYLRSRRWAAWWGWLMLAWKGSLERHADLLSPPVPSSIRLSTHLPICPSIHLPVHPSIHPMALEHPLWDPGVPRRVGHLLWLPKGTQNLNVNGSSWQWLERRHVLFCLLLAPYVSQEMYKH